MKYDVEYSENIPEGFGGVCITPFIPLYGTAKIIIRPKYKNDIGLLKHEVKHAEQYSKNLLFNIGMYISSDYRYRCELEAYNEQIKEYKYKHLYQTAWIIKALLTKYNLGISEHKITMDILKLLPKE